MECDGCCVCRGGWLSLSCSRLHLIIHINDVVFFWHRICCILRRHRHCHLIAPPCLCFRKGQILIQTANWSSSNRSLMNIHVCKSVQMVALTVGSMCKQWSGSSSGQEASRASLRPSPWLPGGLHLQHRSQWREPLQYLQLATYYHSWVCFCTAPRLHPGYSSLPAPAKIKDTQQHYSDISASYVLQSAKASFYHIFCFSNSDLLNPHLQLFPFLFFPFFPATRMRVINRPHQSWSFIERFCPLGCFLWYNGVDPSGATASKLSY